MDEVTEGLFVVTVEDVGDKAPIREYGIAILVSL